MRRLRIVPLRLLVALGALVALTIPVMPALGQGSTDISTIKISIDSPSDGIDVQNGRRVVVGGWAADTAAMSSGTTGVDQVRVYLDGPMDSGKLLGSAKYGNARTDVAGILGNNVYTNTGFDYAWTPQQVGLGQHIIFVYAHSSVSDTWAYNTVTVNGPFFLTPTATAAPVAAPPPPQQQQQQQQQAGPQTPGNPSQGPLTPYGGNYLNNTNGYGNYGNNYGYMGGGYNGYMGGGYPPYGQPPYGQQPYGPPVIGPQCGVPFSSSAGYPTPCSSNRWQNGAPFVGW